MADALSSFQIILIIHRPGARQIRSNITRSDDILKYQSSRVIFHRIPERSVAINDILYRKNDIDYTRIKNMYLN